MRPGKDLHRAENVGKLDPYVEMAVGDQVRRTKTDREGAQNPAWNQKLKCVVLSAQDRNVFCWCFCFCFCFCFCVFVLQSRTPCLAAVAGLCTHTAKLTPRKNPLLWSTLHKHQHLLARRGTRNGVGAFASATLIPLVIVAARFAPLISQWVCLHRFKLDRERLALGVTLRY